VKAFLTALTAFFKRKTATMKLLMKPFLGFSALLLSVAATAQPLYIRFDDSFMDEAKFHYPAKGDNAYYSSFIMSDGIGTSMSFEVGTVAGKAISTSQLTEPSRISPSASLTSAINSGERDVYIALPSGSGFMAYPVSLSSYFSILGGNLVYIDQDCNVSRSFNNLIGGENLSLEGGHYGVYYMGSYDYCDRTVYQFQKDPHESCYPPSDISIMAGVGLLEERIGFTEEDASINAYTVHDIDGNELCTYLSQQGKQVLPQYAPTNYVSTESVYIDRVPEPDAMPVATTSMVEVQCQPSNMSGYHVVQKGETLYSISRKYGLSIEQVKQLNKLTSDQVGLCTSLSVVAPPKPIIDTPTEYAIAYRSPAATLPVTTPKVQAAPKPTKPATKPVTKVTTKPAPKVLATTSAKPIKKLTSSPTKATPQKSASLEKAPVFYTVKAGETLYSIARRYGFTTEKLIQLNALSPNATVTVGQKIKVNDCVCSVPTDLTPKGGPAVAPSSYNQVSRVVGLRRTHTVQESENLPSIARMYNISVAHIRELNRMAPDEIVIPMQVIIVD
jgi:LysM repeat protein